jgi:class 3 adenylate cyclase
VTGAILDSKSNITKELLGLLLPKFVLDRMDNFYEANEKTVHDDVGEISILFCDIADFDVVVRENEENIIRLLDKIFRNFDDLCVVHGVQKIETVGKTYMAAAGLKYIEESLSKEQKVFNPTERVINLAKDMMEEIKLHKGLSLKIGVHKGSCVMGVIGYHKPQFSLIGDTVNTTSRHCTTGEKGRIMVSREAYKFLSIGTVKTQGYQVKEVMTEMKGKGMVEVYHIYPKTNMFKSKLSNIVKAQGEGAGKELQLFKNILAKENNLRGKQNGGATFLNILSSLNKDVKYGATLEDPLKSVKKREERVAESPEKSRLQDDGRSDPNYDILELEDDDKDMEDGDVALLLNSRTISSLLTSGSTSRSPRTASPRSTRIPSRSTTA